MQVPPVHNEVVDHPDVRAYIDCLVVRTGAAARLFFSLMAQCALKFGSSGVAEGDNCVTVFHTYEHREIRLVFCIVRYCRYVADTLNIILVNYSDGH